MKRWKAPHSHSGEPFAVEGAASEQPQLLPAIPQGKGPERGRTAAGRPTVNRLSSSSRSGQGEATCFPAGAACPLTHCLAQLPMFQVPRDHRGTCPIRGAAGEDPGTTLEGRGLRKQGQMGVGDRAKDMGTSSSLSLRAPSYWGRVEMLNSS